MSLSKHCSLNWRCAVLLGVLFVLVAETSLNAEAYRHNSGRNAWRRSRQDGRQRIGSPTAIRRLSSSRKRYPVPSPTRYSVKPTRFRNTPYAATPHTIKPVRVRKVLTEQNGVLTYKRVNGYRKTSSRNPKQYVPGSSRTPGLSRTTTSSTVGRNQMITTPHSFGADNVRPRLNQRTPAVNYHARFPPNNDVRFSRPTNAISTTRHSVRPTIVRAPTDNELIDGETQLNNNPSRNPSSDFKLYRPPSDVNVIDSNSFLTDLIPPDGLRIVMAGQNDKPTSTGTSATHSSPPLTFRQQTLNPTVPRLHHPTYPSSPEVLRIRTTSVSEAQTLLAGIGTGFKITIINTTAGDSAQTKGLRSGGKDFDLVTTTTTLPNESSTTADNRHPSPRRDTTAHAKQWWKGNHVCMKESQGLFGLTEAIMKKVRTVETCKERRNRYVCTERYGFGKRTPKKTTTYKCCSGYVIGPGRIACELDPHDVGATSSSGSSWVYRMSHADMLSARSVPDTEILTIFMPNDDVVIAAFMSQNDSGIDDSLQVQSFLENHVIADKKLLSTRLQNDQIFLAVSGNPIRINFFPNDFDDIMTANCRKVSLPDVINDNSVVHFIDEVIEEVSGSIADYISERSEDFSVLHSVLSNSGLLSMLQHPNDSYTLFAPTNAAFDAHPVNSEARGCLEALARNHVIDHVVCTAGTETRKRNVTSMHGETMTMHQHAKNRYIGDSRITTHDIMTTNGVIHVVDAVLKPSSVSSILDVLTSDRTFSSFLEMIQAAGIKDDLATGNNFTLVVPTNRAFKKIPKSQMFEIVSDTETLRTMLMYHVIPKVVNTEDLKNLDTLETLIPPKDIHVSKYMKRIRMPSKGRKRFIRKPVSALQCARVLRQPETKPCNGAILIVDRVLKHPSGSLMSAMMYSMNSNFSTLLAAIRRAELDYILDSEDTFTFFAPSDVAFARFAPHVTQRLLSNTALLVRVLKFHLVPGYHCAHALLQRSYRHRTYLGSTITSCPKRKRIYLGRKRNKLRAKVLEGDIQATNGVIHAIDNLLLPRRFNLFN